MQTHSQHWQRALQRVGQRVADSQDYRVSGRITRATGLVLEAVGLKIPLGSGCRIEVSPHGQDSERFAEAEVVGFSGDKLFLMPLAELGGLVAAAPRRAGFRGGGRGAGAWAAAAPRGGVAGRRCTTARTTRC